MGTRLEQLCADFNKTPKAAIRTALATSSHCYSPAFVLLERQSKESDEKRGWASLKCGRGGSKGKAKEVAIGSELAKEKIWLMRRLGPSTALEILASITDRDPSAAEMESEKREDESAAAAGLLVECVCCFGAFRFEVMRTLPAAHIFDG